MKTSASLAFFLFAGGLAAQSLASYVRTDKPEAVVDIRAGQQSSFKIPRTVYGIYTEKGVFEGMSAQLLDNPSLEDYYGYLPALNARFSDPAFANSLTMGLPLPWQALRDAGKRYESRFGAGAANSNRYLYLIGLPHRRRRGSKGGPRSPPRRPESARASTCRFIGNWSIRGPCSPRRWRGRCA